MPDGQLLSGQSPASGTDLYMQSFNLFKLLPIVGGSFLHMGQFPLQPDYIRFGFPVPVWAVGFPALTVHIEILLRIIKPEERQLVCNRTIFGKNSLADIHLHFQGVSVLH